ncbi:MAG: DUF2085 domain-containing protein [Acidobacteriota bacterium]
MYAPASQYVPQTGSNHRPIAMWLIVATLSLSFIAIILGAPLAVANGYEAIGNTIYLALHHVCHQIPERSFFIAGHQFAVCARCTGIYAGFAAATLAYPLFKSLRQTATPARKWLFVAAAPLAIDWAIEFFGIWHNTHFSRFLTGALLGFSAVFYVMPGLIDLSLRKWGARTPPHPLPGEVLPATSFPTNRAPSDYSAPHRRI